MKKEVCDHPRTERKWHIEEEKYLVDETRRQTHNQKNGSYVKDWLQ